MIQMFLTIGQKIVLMMKITLDLPTSVQNSLEQISLELAAHVLSFCLLV